MKRTNPKGEEPGWQRITWDEAMETIGSKFQEIMDQYGGQSIFNMCGTSRQWVYGPYAFYKWLFDTPNAHVASEICKGPRRLMGWISSVDGAPWMALRDGPRVYVQWGTAPENSNYDDSCRNLVDRMSAAETHICIDPRLSGSGKEADYWLNLEPGTDGALALAWQHILIEKDLIDWEFVKRWTDASLLVVEDMEPTGGRYLDLSSPIQVPALQDLIGTKLKTRLLKEMDLVEGGSPHKFMAWNKKANDGKGGLVYWDTDTTQWQGCNHVAPTRDQMEVVYAGTSQEGYLPPISYWELEEAGIDFDLEGEHEVTLADGTKHIARPVWSYLAKSVAELHPGVGQRDHRSRPAAHRGVVHGVGHASRGADLRQRRHPPEPGARPDRQLRADGSRGAQPHLLLGQLRRPGRQPRSFPHAGRRAGHGRSRHQHAPGSEVDLEGHGGAHRPAHVPADVFGRQAGRPDEYPGSPRGAGQHRSAPRSSPFCRTTTSGPTPPAFGRHASVRASTR